MKTNNRTYGQKKTDRLGEEKKLLCATCLKWERCKILNSIRKVDKRLQSLNTGQRRLFHIETEKQRICLEDELKTLKEKRVKCLRSRRFLHLFNPKFICFRDDKLENSHSIQYRFCYCNMWKEYVLLSQDEEPTIESLGWD